MNAQIVERNLATARAFLHGTHSPDLADLAVIDRTVAHEIRCHGFPGGDPRDRESYKAFFRNFRAAFSDMEFAVESLVADESHVAARWQLAVTHSAPFAGVEATGRRVRVEGMVLYRLESGLIAETWLHIDQLALLSQIGAVVPANGARHAA